MKPKGYGYAIIGSMDSVNSFRKDVGPTGIPESCPVFGTAGSAVVVVLPPCPKEEVP